jgi:hypothetical protein
MAVRSLAIAKVMPQLGLFRGCCQLSRASRGRSDRIPPGAWMFVLCVLHCKDERYSQDSQDRVVVQMKYGGGGEPGRGGWRDFLHPFTPPLWPTQPPVQWVPGLFRGVKAAGAWR